MIARLRARWACHRSFFCCQYVDQTMCNSWDDPHFFARLVWRLRAWTQLLVEWVLRNDEPNDLTEVDDG
jgi:hypothetical protein